MHQQSHDHTRAHRAAFTLTELLMALSALSALSVLTMTVICSLISAEQHAAESLFIDLNIANLAADLRNDAHSATAVEFAEPNESGQVSLVKLIDTVSTRVSYECTSEGVIRRRQHLDKVVSTDTYRLALGESHFKPLGDSGVLIWIHEREVSNIGGFARSSVQEADVRMRTYQIDAAIGLTSSYVGEAE